MATATAERPQTEETATKSRKRVDASAVATENPLEKLTINLAVPAEMKVLLRDAAQKSSVSETQFARDVLARHLGYTVPEQFNERKGRKGAFAGMTEEERKAAIAEQNAKKRDNVNKILEAIASGNIDLAKLSELGIDPTLLPKPRTAKNGSKEE